MQPAIIISVIKIESIEMANIRKIFTRLRHILEELADSEQRGYGAKVRLFI
jgi:hypothetical protein